MDRQILREVISIRGWKTLHLALALGYSHGAVRHWLAGRSTVPPEAMAWVARLPDLPSVDPSYPPDRAGLAKFMLDGNYTTAEIALMVHTAAVTVYKWLCGRAPVPDGVGAWLRAGGPSGWLWWPPGYTPPTGTISGRPCKPVSERAGKFGTHLERYPSVGDLGGWRWRRVGGPRSYRRLQAARTGRNPQAFKRGRPLGS